MPMLLFYMPLIVMTGLLEVMLKADELEADQRMPDPADQMINATVIHFPGYGQALRSQGLT